MSDTPNDFRNAIEAISDQLCKTVDGDFNFRVRSDSMDPSVEKLLVLINFMLDRMDRSVTESEIKSQLLQQQVELAQAASSAKADFLANMSHEIRTPLNGIIGLTSLLQHSDVDDEQSDLINGIRISSDNLLAIINDILDFSKIEAGKLELETVDFDLQAMVQEVAESQAARAAQKQLELVVRFIPNTPTKVAGDESRLRQVLINLVGNALKFTEQGYVMIGVNFDDDSFQFQVEDTGIGIPEDRRESLFEEFTQADTSTTRRFGGTGLGLAISKRIIETMGGAIKVRPRHGGGSVFAFDVPLEVTDEIPCQMLPTRSVSKSNLHVLVVDDNQTNRFVLHEQLLYWNIHCETAKDANEGFDLMRMAYESGNPYDIAILDYAMPEEDGATLARRIKHSPYADTLLVMLSSLGKTFKNQELIDMGFCGALLKPAPQDIMKELLRVLCAALDGETVPPLITRQTLVNHRNQKLQQPDSGVTENLQVLLAEDNVVNQKVACALLEKMGCRTYVANNGLEALDIAQRFPVDVILMDMQMPEMNGVEATRELRDSKHLHLQKIPIIALTANATAQDRDLCIEAGMDDFLSKPFRPDALKEKLSLWSKSS